MPIFHAMLNLNYFQHALLSSVTQELCAIHSCSKYSKCTSHAQKVQTSEKNYIDLCKERLLHKVQIEKNRILIFSHSLLPENLPKEIAIFTFCIKFLC